MIFKGYLFSILYAGACLGLGFLLSLIPGCNKKITRKVVHILVGAEWIILYHFFDGGIHTLLVCLLFLGILSVSHKKNLMPMISSDGDNAPGTVYYALAMSIMAIVTVFIPDMMIPFGIGVFCTSLGDGFAGLFGQIINTPSNPKIYGNKTVYGTLFNFIFCFIAAGVFNGKFDLGMTVWHIIAIAIFAVELELLSGRGLDNISVTLGTSFLAFFFINNFAVENYIVPILITPVMIAFSGKKKALTVGGIIAALIVDFVISLSLGNYGFIILLSFFILGVASDKIKKIHKKTRQNHSEPVEKRGTSRDHVQVFANSIAASICAVIYFVTKEKIFIVAFVATFAEALADTFASGIGILSGKAFDPFRMRSCPPGLSGGMSLVGTIASLLGATIISFIALACGLINFPEAIIVTVAAFLGAVLDSLLGSLLQIKYRCPLCDEITEREEHCGQKTVRHSGFRAINNDTVNFIATIFSAALSILICSLM